MRDGVCYIDGVPFDMSQIVDITLPPDLRSDEEYDEAYAAVRAFGNSGEMTIEFKLTFEEWHSITKRRRNNWRTQRRLMESRRYWKQRAARRCLEGRF